MSQVAEPVLAFDAAALVRPAVRGLPSYTREPAPVTKPAREIQLAWNESPHGSSPKARAALAAFDYLHRYPEFDAHTLRQALGRYVGAPVEQVVAGAGLDDVLVTLATLLIDPGDRVIISEPTFGVYRPLFATHGGEVINVPLRSDFTLNAESILATVDPRTKLIVICNPNNPTGNLFDPVVIERIVAEAPCLVAIDEAYAEFAGVSHRVLMDRYPNVAVLRTMSKFAGLAGMRVGYGVFPLALMEHMLRVMPGFCNVSAAATVAALASLDDLAYLEGVVARIVADRDHLADQMRAIPGVVPFPSATNFILARLPVANGALVVAELARRGIYVRHFGRPELGLVDCLRVSVGAAEDNAVFVAELADVLREVGS